MSRTRRCRQHARPGSANREAAVARARSAGWAVVAPCIMGGLLVPTHAEAQQGRTVITATATVAAEATYRAFDAAAQAQRGAAVADPIELLRNGVKVEVRRDQLEDPRVRHPRVVWVFFTGS
jgi:hypothetical protein